MKKFTKEEAASLPMLRGGRHTNVHVNLVGLEVGEAMLIEKGIDWKSKTPPYSLINRFAAKHKRQFEKGRSVDGKGWIVKRIS